MDLKFRYLRADEIECRVQTVKVNGCSILLYKDARVDQNILDETVRPMNWQRHHLRDNANCIVSIWDEDKAQWIEKEDTGTESNTEAEKGLASDSFKRACFNWGIGRELYTAPFIWITNDKCNITDGKKCYDRFKVSHIKIEDGRITELDVINTSQNNRKVFRYGNKAETIGLVKARTLKKLLEYADVNMAKYMQQMKVERLEDLTEAQYTCTINKLKAHDESKA